MKDQNASARIVFIFSIHSYILNIQLFITKQFQHKYVNTHGCLYQLYFNVNKRKIEKNVNVTLLLLGRIMFQDFNS